MNTVMTPSNDYQIKKIFSEAWDKVSGLKGRFWAAFLIIIGITVVTSTIAFSVEYLVMGDPTETNIHPVAQIIQMIFSVFITTPLFAGVLMLSLRHCEGKVLPFTSVFNYLGYWKKLWVYPVALTVIALVQNIDSSLLRFAMTLLTIYLTVTYFMYIPLIADKNLDIIPALELSRKTTSKVWFKTLGFFVLILLIMIASALTLGIAYIWTLPWIYNSIAILYRTLFNTLQA